MNIQNNTHFFLNGYSFIYSEQPLERMYFYDGGYSITIYLN